MHLHLLTASPCRHPMPAVACPLCRQPDRQEATADQVLALLRQATDKGATAVTLRDGDLLQRPEALDLLAEARTQGLRTLEVWTAGPQLARPGLAQAVAQAGATQVAVPMYGDSAAAHDHVTGQPGHFQRTLQALQAIRQAGMRPVVLAPILRQTYRNLPQLVQKSLPAGVQAFHFVTPLGPDRVAEPLVPPLPLTARSLQAALQVVQAGKRTATVLDVPLCVLGDRAESLAMPQILDALSRPAQPGTFGKPCESCTRRDRCPGLPPSRADAWVGYEPFA